MSGCTEVAQEVPQSEPGLTYTSPWSETSEDRPEGPVTGRTFSFRTNKRNLGDPRGSLTEGKTHVPFVDKLLGNTANRSVAVSNRGTLGEQVYVPTGKGRHWSFLR